MIGVRIETYVTMRLQRWGIYQRWLAHGGTDPRPARVRSWYGPMILDRLRQVSGKRRMPSPYADACPVEIDEARETQRCVRALDAVYPALSAPSIGEVLAECYVWGGTTEQKLSALRCCRDTYYRRLDLAHQELLGLFNDAASGRPLPMPAQTSARVA